MNFTDDRVEGFESVEVLSNDNNKVDTCCSHLPDWMSPFFWDTDTSSVDITQNRRQIISRLLNFGDQYTLKWLFDTYTEEEILDTVKNSRDLLLKSATFWQKYFDLDETEMRFFKFYHVAKDFYNF